MDYVYAVIGLLAGLGSLLLGFKLLSENIEKMANGKIKKLINKTGKNRFIGVGIGAAVTAIVQSSGATTVMIVGFVNAGLMSLFQATALVMGANIGTTITAQIVALNAFDISLFLMLCVPVGIAMVMISKREKGKTIGMTIVGLGLVFLALYFMKDSMTVFKESENVQEILTKVNNPFLLLLIGILFTVLLQSSSATTTILITMVGNGLIIGNGGNAILYVVLGTNIGSTATALLSALGANTNAKRVSIIHLLFNVFGSMIFFILLLCWKDFMDMTFAKMFENPETQIAMFHTFFNLVCTLIFLPFINVFVRLSTLIIKDKKEETITSLDVRFLNNPAIAISQSLAEILKFGRLCTDTLSKSINDFINKDNSRYDEIHDDIEKIDALNREIVSYMVRISGGSVQQEDEKKISTLHYMITDFYRLAEIADNMCKYTRDTIDHNLEFSKEVYDNIRVFNVYLETQYKNVFELVSDEKYMLISDIDELEDKMDALRSSMIKAHIERLERGECKPNNSGVYINLVSNLERAGDHLNYIAHMVCD
ncbi:MAG: Na/Pi cotransporter family protein [Acholeplasmatales bacterium]|nr:Na/Pi cotransporter family protein [Acholeplasmatales bacterium]